MTDEGSLDARIGALLRGPGGPPDEAFVRRIEQRIAAERRLQAARRAAWRRFATEAGGSLAMLAAFMLLYSVAPARESGPALGPAMAATMLIGLWFLVVLRPAAARG